MSPRPSNPQDPDRAETRCVMLVGEGEHPPQPLLDLLRGQTGDPRGLVCVKHPLLAIAHLATLERHRATRKATHDESSTEGSILVVVNRETWWDLSRLFETIRQRMPAVGIWVCTNRQDPDDWDDQSVALV